MLRPRQTGTGSGSRTPVIDECLGCISGAGSAGPRLRSQEGGKGGEGFRAAREGVVWCLPSMLAPARSRCRCRCVWCCLVWMNSYGGGDCEKGFQVLSRSPPFFIRSVIHHEVPPLRPRLDFARRGW